MFLILCTNQNSQNLKMFITMFKILLIKTSKTVKCKYTLYGSREILAIKNHELEAFANYVECAI